LEDFNSAGSLHPVEWGGGKVQLEYVFLGKTHRVELDGPFARIGNDPRCEVCIPDLPAPVCVYFQVCRTYLAVLELVETEPPSICDPVYAMPGATVWLKPNARITVESISPSTPGGPNSEVDAFSWESFNVDDIRVFPNTLVARSGFFSSEASSTHLRIQSALTLLGTSAACHLRPNHKHISKFQAILFRGENQGESCRVIDLFGEHTTLVDDRPANGQALEVGSQLRISNLNFEAVRFLYNASRPNQLVEVRHQFSTLPLATKPATSSTDSKPHKPIDTDPNGMDEVSKPEVASRTEASLPGIHSMRDRMLRAIGFDSGPSQQRKIHFPTEEKQTEPSQPQSSISTDPKLIDRLERVVKSQERIADQFEKLTSRLEGIEKSLEALPELIEGNSQHVYETINSLKGLVEQTGTTTNEEKTVAIKKPVDVQVSNLGRTNPKKIDTRPSTHSKEPLAKGKQSTNQTPTTGLSNGKFAASTPKAQPSTAKPFTEKPSTGKKTEASSPDRVRSWLQRTATSLAGWIPNTETRRRETAQRNDQNNPLNLGSQSTAKRTRLQHHEDESELLAASESKEESLVLGSLMGLRYRDARKSFLKWVLFALILTFVSLVGGPLVWRRIPEGWRELLWQKITFAKPPQEPEYKSSFEQKAPEQKPPEQKPPEAPSEPASSTDSATTTDPDA
jgi:hypothetical protein